MARADDPSIMTRNPALLADLWDDQAMIGAHLALADVCFQPTGAYSLGVLRPDVSVFDEDEGPIFMQAQDDDTDLDGNIDVISHYEGGRLARKELLGDKESIRR